jgi:hypothetical protein
VLRTIDPNDAQDAAAMIVAAAWTGASSSTRSKP